MYGPSGIYTIKLKYITGMNAQCTRILSIQKMQVGHEVARFDDFGQ
jgi:hypothetical protein